MSERFAISVVVPAYNEERIISTCLQHLLDQDLGRRYEIILSNNNSTDRTAEIAAMMGVSVINATEKGYVHAAIAGVRAAQADIIAMTDADTRVPKDWLRKILNAFEAQPELVAVGGPFVFHDGPRAVQAIVYILNRISPRLMVASLSGTNMAFRKSAYESVGGHNPAINLQADTYLGFKLQKYGTTILLRDNVVLGSARRYKTIWQIFSETGVRIVNTLFLRLFNRTVFKNQPDAR